MWKKNHCKGWRKSKVDFFSSQHFINFFFTNFNLYIFFFFFNNADEIHLARQKSKADADFYQTKQLAAANSLLLTKDYLELKKYEALSNNNKIYYGESIPQMFISSGAFTPPAEKEVARDSKPAG